MFNTNCPLPMKKICFLISGLLALCAAVSAQRRLSFNNVTEEHVQAAGNIVKDNTIKGYYLLVQDDQLNKDSSHYALRILDENLNFVKEIQLRESNAFTLVEAATNDNSMAFLGINTKTHHCRLLVYDSTGSLAYSYLRPYVKEQGKMPFNALSQHNPNGNKNLYNAGRHGYVVTYLLGNHRGTTTFELHYYDSQANKQWKYNAPKEAHRNIKAMMMTCTDSMMVLNVINSRRYRDVTTRLMAFGFNSRKKIFDIDGSRGDYAMVPASVIADTDHDTLFVMGNYFKGNKKEWNRHSEGIGMIKMDNRGHIYSETYDSWGKDLGPSLEMDRHGKSSSLGYLYLHEFLPGPDGKFFAVAEGYKRRVNVGGIFFSILSIPFAGRTAVTEVASTRVMILEFDNKLKLKRDNIYDKGPRTISHFTDFHNIHRLGNLYGLLNMYDYMFTTVTEDRKNFSICYNDATRDGKHDLGAVRILRYNGSKFRTDEVRYTNEDRNVTILPAKAGSLLFFEYDKKKKKTSMRLEKVS